MSEQSQSWLRKMFGKRGPSDPEGSASLDSGETPCSEARDNASDYIDGEMPASLSERVKQHLGICDSCDGWMKTLATTVGLVREVPQEEVPESLRQKIRDIPGSNR